MLTDPRIHSFLALCKHGTTTAAAAATNRALSTISTHVSAIEARIGAALFKRAHGVFTLTELGEEVRAHVETIGAAEEAILATATLIKQRRQTVATTYTNTHGRRATGQVTTPADVLRDLHAVAPDAVRTRRMNATRRA